MATKEKTHAAIRNTDLARQYPQEEQPVLRPGAVHVSGGKLTGNSVDANGRDGIAISEENGFVISSNKADSNGRYGVAVGGARGETAGSNNTTKTNHALGNGVLDLFWDTNGTGNTWASNTCDTETSGLTLCL